ncbi:glycosyltransferase [Leptolyngbya sp. NK1-12]|uniref:Glycosyltransferase n=1 Tax=Leptolyngbya sp. NK1-12 TaxID=2547451 RepID=A0AA97AJD8_9CYAN|nr:glycosyltransferase family 4 protein [Leptolyngbya sp. NK1-12]WNZ27675.1 glycosyltransferase [Leptolyngbya sp. NK1-12]
MKVLHLSSFDSSGGAARAAYRIHVGLKQIGIDSQMLVQYQAIRDQTVLTVEDKVKAKLRSILDSSISKFRSPTHYLFSPQWIPDAVAAKVAQIDPDIINLNWVCNSFLRIETLLRLQKPLVWTLQDMWPFTGGCHYSLGCDRYQVTCGHCPQLNSTKEQDLSRWVWQRKAKAWQHLNLAIVAPSQWMAKAAKGSSLFRNLRIEVIPFGLDTTVFKPLDMRVARDLLNLPQNKQLVLFGAIDATGDKRKGFHLLQAALERLRQADWSERIELIIFGSSAPDNPLDLGFEAHFLGHLHDDLSLRIAYAAADVMIAPSIEESFGQTASEALACGTPVVVFRDTGLADIVDHLQNGYIAQHCDIQDLAQGIAWILSSEQHHELRVAARRKAEQAFSFEVVGKQHLSLYEEILQETRCNQGLLEAFTHSVL